MKNIFLLILNNPTKLAKNNTAIVKMAVIAVGGNKNWCVFWYISSYPLIKNLEKTLKVELKKSYCPYEMNSLLEEVPISCKTTAKSPKAIMQYDGIYFFSRFSNTKRANNAAQKPNIITCVFAIIAKIIEYKIGFSFALGYKNAAKNAAAHQTRGG